MTQNVKVIHVSTRHDTSVPVTPISHAFGLHFLLWRKDKFRSTITVVRACGRIICYRNFRNSWQTHIYFFEIVTNTKCLLKLCSSQYQDIGLIMDNQMNIWTQSMTLKDVTVDRTDLYKCFFYVQYTFSRTVWVFAMSILTRQPQIFISRYRSTMTYFYVIFLYIQLVTKYDRTTQAHKTISTSQSGTPQE